MKKSARYLSVLLITWVMLLLGSCQVVDLIFGSKDTTPPIVTIISPAQGATVSGQVTVSATASDAEGIFRVVFYADNLQFAESRTAPYQVAWNTGTVTAGLHYLKAVAYDKAGNTGTSPTITVTVEASGGSFLEDFDGYSVGATGTLSGNMPADASWYGLTMGNAALTIVNTPLIGSSAPAMRLAHGTNEDDTANFFAQVPGMTKGFVEFKVQIDAVSPGALCISLGSGSMLLDNTATAFFLWLVDTDDGEGTTAAWFTSSSTVGFGTDEISKASAHTLRIAFDTTTGKWGAYLDGNVLVYSRDFAQTVASMEFISISTMGLSSDWFGGSFVVDDITAEADLLITIPGETGDDIEVAAPGAVSAAVEGSAVRLNWTDNADNETGYVIYKGQTSSMDNSWDILTILGADTSTYLDTAVVAGQTYYYQVASYIYTGGSYYYGIPGQYVWATLPSGGDPTSGPPADGVYIAGAWLGPADSYNRAVLWYDDGTTITRINLSDGSSNAVANAVAVGADGVYACGYQEISSGHRAMLWKIFPDGTVTPTVLKQNMVSTHANYVRAHALAIDGTDIYVAGEDWDSPGTAAVVWKNGTRIQLNPDYYDPSTPVYSSANAVVAEDGVAFVIGTTDQVNGITFDAHCWVVSGTSLAGHYTLDPTAGPSYAQAAAMSGDDLYVAGHRYVSGYYWASYWLDDPATTTYNQIGGYTSYGRGIAEDGGIIHMAGYQQIEGDYYLAKYWRGTTSGGFVERTLPVPASAERAYAEKSAAAAGTAYIAGEWSSTDGVIPCYWMAGPDITGRRDLEPAGIGSVEGLAVKNPVHSYTLPENLAGNATPILLGAFYEGSIDPYETVWLSLPVQAGGTYLANWEDSYRPTGSGLTADVLVSVYDADRVYPYQYSSTSAEPGTTGFVDVDSGHENNRYIHPTASETIQIRVKLYNDVSASPDGTYRLRVSRVD